MSSRNNRKSPARLHNRRRIASIRAMAKKQPGSTKDATFTIRLTKQDLELFRFAAEQEHYSGKIAVWMLHHLKIASKKHQAEFQKQAKDTLP